MYRSQKRPIGALTLTAGERTYAKMVNGVRNQFVTVIVRATVTVATNAATALRNRGSAFALIDEIGIDENGTDRHVYRGPVLRALSEASAPSALSAVRAQTAIGTYSLEESARIYFQHPLALDPGETAFIERDPMAELRVFAKLAPTADQIGRLFNVGTATVTVTGITLTVIQGYDMPGTAKAQPIFLPTARQELMPVTGASSALLHYLRSNHAIRYIVISPETTTVGEVQDIVNRVALKGDSVNIIGPSTEDIDDVLLEAEYGFGGATPSNRAHTVIDFQQHGKLSELLYPALQDTNMRLEFDAQPSASAGTSQVRITIVEMTRVGGITRPAESVPFPVGG